MDYDLGYFDLEAVCWEPLENPFGPKVLPMSPERFCYMPCNSFIWCGLRTGAPIFPLLSCMGLVPNSLSLQTR